MSASISGSNPELELELGPYITLGRFCGIRSSELENLTWHEVRLHDRFVTVPPKIAKKRCIRNIPLEEAAVAWLGHFGAQCSGPIAPIGVAKRLRKLRENASALAPREGEYGNSGVRYFSPILKWPTFVRKS